MTFDATFFSRAAMAGALLSLSCAAHAVVMNDLFVNRIDLGTVANFNEFGANVGFSGESGEPAQSGQINSAWWQWSAPGNGNVTIDTFGSDFDTFLTVATGAAVDALTVLARNDDASGTLQSQISFDAFAGMSYQIAVDGFRNATGSITLNLASAFPTNAPEPTTILLLGLGLAGLGFARKRLH